MILCSLRICVNWKCHCFFFTNPLVQSVVGIAVINIVRMQECFPILSGNKTQFKIYNLMQFAEMQKYLLIYAQTHTHAHCLSFCKMRKLLVECSLCCIHPANNTIFSCLYILCVLKIKCVCFSFRTTWGTRIIFCCRFEYTTLFTAFFTSFSRPLYLGVEEGVR